MQDGKILIVEPCSNDLKVFDNNFKLIQSLKGIPGDMLGKVMSYN